MNHPLWCAALHPPGSPRLQEDGRNRVPTCWCRHLYAESAGATATRSTKISLTPYPGTLLGSHASPFWTGDFKPTRCVIRPRGEISRFSVPVCKQLDQANELPHRPPDQCSWPPAWLARETAPPVAVKTLFKSSLAGALAIRLRHHRLVKERGPARRTVAVCWHFGTISQARDAAFFRGFRESRFCGICGLGNRRLRGSGSARTASS